MYKSAILLTLLTISCGESMNLKGSSSIRDKESNSSDYSAVSHGGGIDSYNPDINYAPMPSNTPNSTPQVPVDNNPKPTTPVKKKCLRGSSNRKGLGPYTVASLKEFSGYTVFYPQEMSSENCLFPWIVWGNGTTQRGTGYYGAWDKHLASWGIIVIHSHADGGGGLSGAGPMKKGVDIAIQLAGGKMRGKLTAKGGVAGHSQGGIGSQVVASSRSEINAVVDLQGGGMATHSKPALMLTGTTDFMQSSVVSAFGMLRGPAILYNYAGSDHISAPMTNVNYRASAAQFFRWVLAGDPAAKKSFVDCLFCTDTTPKYKNFD